jgi:hypothetical protein
VDSTVETQYAAKPLVELAPDEAVVRALTQSAHPVEWVQAHKPDVEVPESDES